MTKTWKLVYQWRQKRPSPCPTHRAPPCAESWGGGHPPCSRWCWEEGCRWLHTPRSHCSRSPHSPAAAAPRWTWEAPPLPVLVGDNQQKGSHGYLLCQNYAATKDNEIKIKKNGYKKALHTKPACSSAQREKTSWCQSIAQWTFQATMSPFFNVVTWISLHINMVTNLPY